MNSNEFIQIQVQSCLPMRRPADFLGMIKCQVKNLPEYMPTKFGWTEPLKYIFDPQKIDWMIEPGASRATTIHWIRTGKDRARGSWSIRTDFPPDCETKHNHASVNVQIYTTKHQDALLRFFKAMGRLVPPNLGLCDAQTMRYMATDVQNAWNHSTMHITTHILRHWLPDMPWASLWGPDYIDLFGKERLLTTPAYRTELLTDDVVFVQLTPDLNDLWDNFDEVLQARKKAKHHLGYDCFWQKEQDYEWMEHTEKEGKVFRVPDFKFIEDGFPAYYPSVSLTPTEWKLAKKARKQGGVTPAILAEVDKLIAKGCDEVDSQTPAKLEKSYQMDIEAIETRKIAAAIRAERGWS